MEKRSVNDSSATLPSNPKRFFNVTLINHLITKGHEAELKQYESASEVSNDTPKIVSFFNQREAVDFK
uniref:Uncharacterized protein n=1 Tax=Ditylenchus dipsaci TaxID=166011 RepID=A0A915CM09_9BILA